MANDYYIGLISGTSVDGVDCALVQFDDGRPRLLASLTQPYPEILHEQILSLCTGKATSLKLLGETHIAVGRVFADAVHQVLEQATVQADEVTAIGSHGQTIWHEPQGPNPFTMQIGDPNTIAQLTGITTVADFRGQDMAAGGQGAPLAPLLHRELFASDTADRAIVNIGGIGNITFLPSQGDCIAFDTGPGNVLMDAWINQQQGKEFDEDGNWAATGQMQLELLNVLLNEDYFTRAPPKSTGRELFNNDWLERKLGSCASSFKPEDVQATLLTLTASTLASAISQHANAQEIYVCGGGAHNIALMNELARLAGEQSVHPTSKLGVDPDWVEAMCFAYLARQAVQGKASDTGPFTGASKPVVLGGIYKA